MNEYLITSDDVKKLLLKGESLTLEMKKCKKNTLPDNLWESYSAFANTRGGVILLGVEEDKTKPVSERFEVVGVKDANKLITDLFNILNNPQKVNRCVMYDSDVQLVEMDGKDVIYIRVPEAYYRQKPIYINNDLQNGTYKRLHEGDRHVSPEELAMLIRDSSDNVDSQIIEGYGMDDVDPETLRKYRQTFSNRNPGHPYEDLSDKDFMIQMGGYAINRREGFEGITMAGLLMFGKSLPIHENFPNFRVDYLDLIGIEPGDSKKWNDRLTKDGRWVDNIYNFLLLALNRLLLTLPSEGRLKGVVRIDGGELYEGVREGFINTLTYCDYLLGGVLRIDRRTDRIVMRNPGTLRISPERIYEGDYTQARNSTIQSMLRMVGFGDNIGSGFSKIIKAWKSLGYPHPTIHEVPEVNEVWLTLPLPDDLDHLNDHVIDIINESEGVHDGVNENDPVNDPVNGPIKGNDPVNDLVNDPVKLKDGVNDPIKTESGKLSKIQESVLESIANDGTFTYAQLSMKLNVTVVTVKRAIQELKRQNLISRRGSDKTGYWVKNVKL